VSSLPTTTFSGKLKFQRPTSLNPLGTAAIRFACPEFLELPEPTDEMKAEARLHADAGADRVLYNLEKHRRYAGDVTLPRGAYFSICRDELDDAGTLENEISAYRNPDATGPACVFDLAFQSRRDALKIPGPARPSLAVVLPAQGGTAERFHSLHKDLIPSPGNNAIYIEMPYDVEDVDIKDVIDLRLPSTQRWLFETFRLGDGKVLQKPTESPIGSFLEMLPTLLDTAYGGNEITHALGSYFRQNKVSALIFPSARSNVQTHIKNGRLEDFGGWNLVDYRNASDPPICTGWLDVSPWSQRAPAGVEIHFASTGPYAGSWRVEGVEEWHDDRYSRMLESRSGGT
jgi:hypothetical protein